MPVDVRGEEVKLFQADRLVGQITTLCNQSNKWLFEFVTKVTSGIWCGVLQQQQNTTPDDTPVN